MGVTQTLDVCDQLGEEAPTEVDAEVYHQALLRTSRQPQRRHGRRHRRRHPETQIPPATSDSMGVVADVPNRRQQHAPDMAVPHHQGGRVHTEREGRPRSEETQARKDLDGRSRTSPQGERGRGEEARGKAQSQGQDGTRSSEATVPRQGAQGPRARHDRLPFQRRRRLQRQEARSVLEEDSRARRPEHDQHRRQLRPRPQRPHEWL
mmetsp:Transcript_21313/g.65776  ORF Transcript_21313/g.65776 Transcript_21313/m.65776 type:complete len:207 (+) Transcript_21313:835-1455(+)